MPMKFIWLNGIFSSIISCNLFIFFNLYIFSKALLSLSLEDAFPDKGILSY